MRPRNLTCPACGNTLTEEDICGLKVDICRGGCAGLWFDRGELEKVDESCERTGIVLLSTEKNPNIKVDYEKTRVCPTCQPEVKMRKHFWSVKAQVELDECDKCGGIWLDEGELKKIRSLYSSEAEKIADAREYFRKFSQELIDRAEKERQEKAPWYEKLVYAIFGM